MTAYVVTVQCADRPGIVRAVAEAVVEVGGNITESAQFGDPHTGIFCLRTCFATADAGQERVNDALSTRLAPFDPSIRLRPQDHRRRVVILVSRLDHCLLDLLYRWERGELPVDIPLIVSNHLDCKPVADRAGVAYLHLPVTPAGKPEAEARLAAAIDEHRVEVIVLARYMQVLSDGFCQRYPGQIINIHHSFLPGFKGARPYHQAYERGVKLIGATAHYVTADLDEGPIIDQDVVRVSHSQAPEALAATGRDVERRVLARALHLHAEDRVLVTGSRTVVFAG